MSDSSESLALELDVDKSTISCPITGLIYQTNSDSPSKNTTPTDPTGTIEDPDEGSARRPANEDKRTDDLLDSRKPVQISCGCTLSEGAFLRFFNAHHQDEEPRCPIETCHKLLCDKYGNPLAHSFEGAQEAPAAYYTINFALLNIALAYQNQHTFGAPEKTPTTVTNEDISCPVTQEHFSPNIDAFSQAPIMLVKCGHSFSADALSQMFKTNHDHPRSNRCPGCRKTLLQTIHPLVVNDIMRKVLSPQNADFQPGPTQADLLNQILALSTGSLAPESMIINGMIINDLITNTIIDFQSHSALLIALVPAMFFSFSSASLGMLILNTAVGSNTTNLANAFFIVNASGQIIAFIGPVVFWLLATSAINNPAFQPTLRPFGHNLLPYMLYSATAPYLVTALFFDFPAFLTNSTFIDFFISSTFGATLLITLFQLADIFYLHYNRNRTRHEPRPINEILWNAFKDFCSNLGIASGSNFFFLLTCVLVSFIANGLSCLSSGLLFENLLHPALFNFIYDGPFVRTILGSIANFQSILAPFSFTGILLSYNRPGSGNYFFNLLVAVAFSTLLSSGFWLSLGYGTLICGSRLSQLPYFEPPCQTLDAAPEGERYYTNLLFSSFVYLVILVTTCYLKYLPDLWRAINGASDDDGPQIAEIDEDEEQAQPEENRQAVSVFRRLRNAFGCFFPENPLVRGLLEDEEEGQDQIAPAQRHCCHIM
jgi:hypothetical protein